MEGVCAKTFAATLLLVDFSMVFNSIHIEKMERVLLAYGLPKEMVIAIMMLNKNTDFFAPGILQGDTLAPFQSIICLDNIL